MQRSSLTNFNLQRQVFLLFRLAVGINGFFNIYFGSIDDMRYKLQKVVTYLEPVDFIAVSIFSLFVAHARQVKMLSFNGGLQREWTFDHPISCMTFIGGPTRREQLLIGLQNGDIYKIFSENPFPILMIHQNVAIKHLSLSCDLKKIAIVTLLFRSMNSRTSPCMMWSPNKLCSPR